MFEISAHVSGGGMDRHIVCCFDPTIVVVRLREAFPEVEVNPQDLAWRDYDWFQAHGAGEGAIRMAENDARRRGPLWTFYFRVPDRPPIRGVAERYYIRIWSDDPVPEPLRSRFIEFLQTLRFAPCVEVKSIRLEGNDKYPA